MRKLMLVLCSWLFVVGCSGVEEGSIVDDPTIPLQPSILEEVPSNMLRVSYMIDNMGRDRTQYHIVEDGEVIVEPNIQLSGLKRGDILYYATLEFAGFPTNPAFKLIDYQLSRIIALPGETVKVVDGQIYINNRKLHTHYGRAMKAGLQKEEYEELVRNRDDLSEVNFDFAYMMDELLVPAHHFFVIGDNWWRSVDSRHFGPIYGDLIIGVVRGVTKAYEYEHGSATR